MALNYAVPTPLGYFSTLVQSDDEFPLLEAAASLAQDDHPTLDMQQVLNEVDQLLSRLTQRVASNAPAVQRLQVLNRFFYGDLGFGGNLNHYYDPDNSDLAAVLRTRRGIPISLAVLWMELAQGIGLHVQGVAFPGHFLVKALLPGGQALLDPFNGHSLTRGELEERLEPFQHPAAHSENPSQPPESVPLGVFLQPATPRDIVARMLRNLKEVHHAQQDWLRLLAVQERLVRLLPQAWSEWRDRGLVHAQCGHFAAAVQDLGQYVAHAAGEPDCERMRAVLADLRG